MDCHLSLGGDIYCRPMSINISLDLEQSQRERDDLAACEKQIDRETDFYYHGEFIGLIGCEPDPELWSQLAYRSGYLIGIGEFYDYKYQTVFEDDPF